MFPKNQPHMRYHTLLNFFLRTVENHTVTEMKTEVEDLCGILETRRYMYL